MELSASKKYKLLKDLNIKKLFNIGKNEVREGIRWRIPKLPLT